MQKIMEEDTSILKALCMMSRTPLDFWIDLVEDENDDTNILPGP